MSADDTNRIAGGLFRAYVGAVDALGLRAQVYAGVPEDVRRLMDALPLHTTWLPGDELDHLFEAVARLRGLEGLRQLGFESTRTSTRRFLRPVMETTMALHGRSPTSLFTHLTSITRPFFKGLDFQYTPVSPSSGSLRLRSAYRMNAVSLAAWEGSLRMLFDACDVTTGAIGNAVISDDGHTGTFAVRW
ncbi:hypothetical protein JY651_36350 [Pyxidicoccus parkwayensis]|uniref:Heme NO-binding domain-containing protein n=1 Tax=Pyxidicoccus parkwayensis TaxID=2813578 RepID=A0ABX7NP86_9BACT|nr:hypothetical protein [Pyxidicoccus parkwaysis]QSQ20667.1 hypothetical protein JY651_36350 [Pyxidicoccus parkwaysis]